MSPTALDACDHHDSFSLPAQDQSKVHPSARRTPEGGLIKVESDSTVYEADGIKAKFTDRGASVIKGSDGKLSVKKTEKNFEFFTKSTVGRVGLMLVGLGGNNGTTVLATNLANKYNISWHTKNGIQQPNYIGSVVRASTVRLGTDPETGKDVFVPISDMLPMVHPNDFVIGGWDISSLSMDKAMLRAKVLEWDLQRQLIPLMENVKPLPSIYYPDFIAANQADRADNLIPGDDKKVHLEHIRADIRRFKADNHLDSVVVLWTANTERYADIIPGVNDTADNLLKAVETSHEEVSPSTIFAMASILEGVPFINGSPQNTFVPGCIELAEKHKAFIGGDDFKSGQTKVKSVLAEFLVNAGIKPLSISSYNHLGNNDGKNLSSQRQFRSKEISKSSVVDDMVAANPILYKTAEDLSKATGEIVKKGEHPDHIVVIKHVPAVGDSKRAIDEYYSELLMGGRNVMNIFNECEDSLLATPLIFDLAILAELLTRVTYRENATGEWQPLYSVLSLLSYMLKAPLVKPGEDVVNSLNRQRNALEQFLKACLGLEHSNDLLLNTRVW
ncbi:myo-inositol-1-phosphate synthase [Cryptococcus neoformans]|uniref:Inositol-3-phosphate synthase n=2 Tax=Cryptococcus neoformans TaxID=5207 RepID=INO1_CRYN9|nr:myo-inositol-1-phosphate synthase [Cryptococcus neoformans var. grubii H99]J9VYL3.1 RecName: Full=Inositol-3-phosphate synthase; Short=MIP synthase; AltName: Full=Myo-inositol 1-phosphate synthase; Short=IPS; Short=MI-1-P synthase [Cryptococcus neoformans var. grubii H99]OWZ32759.1 myo-inositol-1-phosphate synthase [Cryptococcus neoformans var. grubii AD1-83a]OWZ39812.1 myo-inositol-1-phosphate synthase [Cryptococcus neoformans var. grubii C23]OWZ50891.1 myo-inositol-1-phosphate synthase [Cr|eukprot:XP_012052586.1 myo-inositol-1-phosphate synthase [Cryptococcus neoformans var. grubii H99]